MIQNYTDIIQLTNTRTKEDIYALFSKILAYPGSDYQVTVDDCKSRLQNFPVSHEPFESFTDFVSHAELTELEELFTRTFDLNDKRPLEVGWHLYGEEYKRGQFLVKMRGMLREYQVAESTELPDHLSHCLLLLPKLDREDAEAFARKYVLPALKNILGGFDSENPYELVLQCLNQLISINYGRQEE